MDPGKRYLTRLTAQLDEWRSQLNLLDERANQLFADARKDYTEELDALIEDYDGAEGSLVELQQTSEQVWDDLKAGMDEALERLEDALETARSRFQ
jgi:chromosome segregation ATPase